jgi:hypothetical protein
MLLLEARLNVASARVVNDKQYRVNAASDWVPAREAARMGTNKSLDPCA